VLSWHDGGLEAAVAAIVGGEHADPFSFLGPHVEAGKVVIRTFLPQARRVSVVDATNGGAIAELSQVHGEGFFSGPVEGVTRPFAYRLRLLADHCETEIEDPYRFPPVLADLDLHLLAEGRHFKSFEKLGAHPARMDGIDGVTFAVWAPSARRVSVIGDFNEWDGRRHPMRSRHESGVWEIFLPGVHRGALYKYEIKTQTGHVLVKADPYGMQAERPPGTASVVHGLANQPWVDGEWMDGREQRNSRHAPIAIYEVHLGSWRRRPEEESRYLTYRELADELLPYVKDMGFTHIEILPVSEHPFDGSWGYQPTALFAPTSRFGPPEDFRAFVERCHQEGLGLILDLVVGHFPGDPHGLAWFDGTHLYEHADPRQGRHTEWGTLIYNYGRPEVSNFLLSNVVYWLEQYHVDGFRVDAVAAMLYLDYGREEGDWLPNRYGGKENLEAIEFVKRMNELVYARHDGAVTAAEESTAWPMVSRPTYLGGLGFGYKWNMGWMNDTLRYMSKDPVHRKYHHEDLTFGLVYAFSENFVLPLSHDEAVHGKGSLVAKMPGNRRQKFANLRAYLAFMYTQPGKKLLFMGNEFGQEREWSHDRGLDWDVLGDPLNAGLHRLVRDLNSLYRGHAALHELDCESEGFAWIDCHDHESSVISYLRKAVDGDDFVVVVCNFTPVVRHAYRIGVPAPGGYQELLNTDSVFYGGGNVGNGGFVRALAAPVHGFPCSLELVLPPLATLVLQPVKE
jgi:1,4-alpha-glucan branching enzyme